MRLFEAIIDANNRAVAGDQNAGLHPADYANEFPIIALTCIDPRLNPLLPAVLGVPEQHFIWLRNAGNIITQPLSSTMRSLALACAVKGGKEIAIIGHSDCQVAKTSMSQLLEKFRVLGVERGALPDNLNDYFGLFATERQNVIKGCEIVRSSPLIGANTPVHGLIVDIETGRLEWVVNGYQTWQGLPSGDFNTKAANEPLGGQNISEGFQMGEMKFPEMKIGEAATTAPDWLTKKIEMPETHNEQPAKPKPSPTPAPIRVTTPPKIPVPPPIRIKGNLPRR